MSFFVNKPNFSWGVFELFNLFYILYLNFITCSIDFIRFCSTDIRISSEGTPCKVPIRLSMRIRMRLHWIFFSARLMTVTGKFRLPIGHSTNRQSKFSSHSHESRSKKSQCKRILKDISLGKWVPVFILILLYYII